MKEGLSLNTLIKIEERLDEMGYKSIDDKIEYFEHITTENIDNDIKSLGIISDEDTKGIIKYLSGLKSFGDQIAETISKMPLLNQQNLPNVERQLKPLGDTLGDIIPRIVFSFSKDMLKGLEQWKSMSQKMFAGITDVNIERINREMFLYRLYKHVHGM